MERESVLEGPLHFRTLVLPSTILNGSLGMIRQTLMDEIQENLPEDELKHALLVPHEGHIFRCFRRKSNGEPVCDIYDQIIPDSTLAIAMKQLHTTGVERSLRKGDVLSVSSYIPKLTYFLPKPSERDEGVDLSYCIVWRSSNGQERVKPESLRDNLIGILEVQWS